MSLFGRLCALPCDAEGALQNGCYPPCTVWCQQPSAKQYPPVCPLPCGSACRDHDQQLHQALVDVASGGRLQDEDILVADRLADGEGGLLVRVVEGNCPGDFDAQSAGTRTSAVKGDRNSGASRAAGLLNVPLRDLRAQLGVAAAADQLDLVCHFGGHGDRISACRSDDGTGEFSSFVQVLAGNPGAGLSHASKCRVPGGARLKNGPWQEGPGIATLGKSKMPGVESLEECTGSNRKR